MALYAVRMRSCYRPSNFESGDLLESVTPHQNIPISLICGNTLVVNSLYVATFGSGEAIPT